MSTPETDTDWQSIAIWGGVAALVGGVALGALVVAPMIEKLKAKKQEKDEK